MIFFGIDPGTTATGYGVIEARNNEVRWLDWGAIVPNQEMDLADKLAVIYDGLSKMLLKYKPSTACVEEAFYAKNAHTTLMLGHARGVALLAARRVEAQIVEFSPREIKKAVVGNGNAAKEQVEYMVRVLLSPPRIPMRSDAYDALAVALCGFFSQHSRRGLWR